MTIKNALLSIMKLRIMAHDTVMLSIVYAECRKILMRVFMLNVIMLNVIMLNVIILIVTVSRIQALLYQMKKLYDNK
jgi:hypothetical protein